MRFFRYVLIPSIITIFVFWVAIKLSCRNNDSSVYFDDNGSFTGYNGFNTDGSPALPGTPQQKMPYY